VYSSYYNSIVETDLNQFFSNVLPYSDGNSGVRLKIIKDKNNHCLSCNKKPRTVFLMPRFIHINFPRLFDLYHCGEHIFQSYFPNLILLLVKKSKLVVHAPYEY